MYITGRLPSISKSCSVELALAITLWLVEFLRHQATANWLNVHPCLSAIFVNNLIRDWVIAATSIGPAKF